MARINLVTAESATAEQKALFDVIHAQLGMVPNFLKAFANSPAALKAFLGLHSIAGDGSLHAQTRERIALALAQHNGCEYCLSAHTAIGRKAGLDGAEIEANRAGRPHLYCTRARGGTRLDLASIMRTASADTLFYICGPGPLLGAARAAARELAIAAERVQWESFQ